MGCTMDRSMCGCIIQRNASEYASSKLSRLSFALTTYAVFLFFSTVYIWAANDPPDATALHPTGLAAFDGVVYLSEASRHRVLFRNEGDPKFHLFTDNGQLVAPAGLAVDEKYVYVADPIAHNVFQIGKSSRSVVALLPPDAGVSPTDVLYVPVYNFDNQKLSSHPSLLVLNKDERNLLRINLATTSQRPVLPWGDRTFDDPVAISSVERNVLVVDRGARTVFEATNAESWSDVRRISPSSNSTATGYFFPELSGPTDAEALGDVIYMIDGHKLFAFLRGVNRLVPLTFRSEPLVDPQQVVVSPNRNALLIADTTPNGVTSWPLLLPVAVEVEAGGDISTPLSALYDYLWKQGVLPTVSIELPYKGPRGEFCQNLACVIERARNLQAKTNLQIEQTLCSINPSVCRKDRITRLRIGETLLIPDVPFESYLSVGNKSADGKSSVGALLDQLIPDPTLRASIDERFVKALNPMTVESLNTVPKKGLTLTLPSQRTRYYAAVRKDEVLSPNSQLANLIRTWPALSMRLYGAYALQGALTQQASPAPSQPDAPTPASQQAAPTPAAQQVTPALSQPDMKLHTQEELDNAYKSVLSTIDFNSDQLKRYLLANDVPILIVETSADCQHPAFFNKDDHAFDDPNCTTPESAADSVVVDWSETTKRHGTCVASIIGARAELYGPSLASGSKLRLSWSGTPSTTNLIEIYQDFREYFVVNISSVLPVVGGGDNENAWTTLLKSGIAKYALFVAAAGNENGLLESKKDYPAFLAETFPNVISVGALDKGGTFVWEDSSKQQGSNTGSAVELLAPGEAVPCATEVIDGKAVYSIAPGTSFAAPLVSAVAALLLDKKLSPPEVKARLLATAVPLEKERSGQPLSRFGRLSVERALLDPKHFHLDYPQNGSVRHLEADARTDNVSISYQSLSDPQQSWKPLPLSDVLSIDLVSDDGANKLYRVVRFITETKGVTPINNVTLSGCFSMTPKGTTEKYLVLFGNGSGCPDVGQFDADHRIADLKTLIAPRLGADKF
jgi:subtilisin family serine protease